MARKEKLGKEEAVDRSDQGDLEETLEKGEIVVPLELAEELALWELPVPWAKSADEAQWASSEKKAKLVNKVK